MDIPESRREEDALRDHEQQKERHEKTILENEEHPRDGVAYHHMKEAKEREQEEHGFIRNKERSERRQQEERDVDLKEEANTILSEGGVARVADDVDLR